MKIYGGGSWTQSQRTFVEACAFRYGEDRRGKGCSMTSVGVAMADTNDEVRHGTAFEPPCNGCCKSSLWRGERNICSPTRAEKLGFEARKKTLVYIVGAQDGHGRDGLHLLYRNWLQFFFGGRHLGVAFTEARGCMRWSE